MEKFATMHKELLTSDALFPKLMELLLDPVCVVDEEGRFVFISAACERLLGYTQEELIGSQMIELVHPDDRERTLAAADRIMQGGSHINFENRYLHKDGRVVHIMWSARWSEEYRARIAVARNVTALKHAEERLRHMAYHDALTGLPNRLLFQDRFNMALRRARRNREKIALLYLDLNEFKEVNDNYGHKAGDQLLRALVRRLVECLRESDTIARMGGDEFTMLLTDIHRPDAIDPVVEKVRAAVAKPFEFDECKITISASIGTAVYPDDGNDLDKLLHHADAGMYAMKRGVATK